MHRDNHYYPFFIVQDSFAVFSPPSPSSLSSPDQAVQSASIYDVGVLIDHDFQFGKTQEHPPSPSIPENPSSSTNDCLEQ